MTLQQERLFRLGAKPQIDVAGDPPQRRFPGHTPQTYPFIKSLVLYQRRSGTPP